MGRDTVRVEHEFAVPVERVFRHLSEHENLADVFGMQVTRVQDGAPHRNGVGSVRRLRLRPLAAFEETVTAYRENQLIEYEITKGTPLNEHHGAMRFSRRESGHASHLEYVITLGSDLPGVARIVGGVLRRRIPRGLARLEARLAEQGAPEAPPAAGSAPLGLVEAPDAADA